MVESDDDIVSGEVCARSDRDANERRHVLHFVGDICRNRDVVHIAREEPDTASLAGTARSVVAVTLSGQVEAEGVPNAVGRRPIVQARSDRLPAETSSADVVVAFQRMEALPEFLGEVKRILRPAGRLILVWPADEIGPVSAGTEASSEAAEPRQGSTAEDLAQLRDAFPEVELWFQRSVAGSLITPGEADTSRPIAAATTDVLPPPSQIIVIASQATDAVISASLFVEGEDVDARRRPDSARENDDARLEHELWQLRHHRDALRMALRRQLSPIGEKAPVSPFLRWAGRQRSFVWKRARGLSAWFRRSLPSRGQKP